MDQYLVDKIQSFRQDGKDLFAGGGNVEFAQEVIRTYEAAVAQGYKPDSDDVHIIGVARLHTDPEELAKIKHRLQSDTSKDVLLEDLLPDFDKE